MPLVTLSSVTEAYFFLFLAICFEVIATSTMKANAGFVSIPYSLIMLFCYACSFSLMTIALEKLDLGVAYAIWSGTGTCLVALVGYLHFREAMPPMKILAIACVICSIIFLQIVSHNIEESRNRESTPLLND